MQRPPRLSQTSALVASARAAVTSASRMPVSDRAASIDRTASVRRAADEASAAATRRRARVRLGAAAPRRRSRRSGAGPPDRRRPEGARVSVWNALRVCSSKVIGMRAEYAGRGTPSQAAMPGNSDERIIARPNRAAIGVEGCGGQSSLRIAASEGGGGGIRTPVRRCKTEGILRCVAAPVVSPLA